MSFPAFLAALQGYNQASGARTAPKGTPVTAGDMDQWLREHAG